MSKVFLFQLNHPAHYHLFKNTVGLLRSSGHEVFLSIKNKDILKDLLEGQEYFIISDKYRDKNFFSISKSLFKRNKAFLKLIKQLGPSLMIGTSPEIGHIRGFVKTPAIFFGEDDVTISGTMYLAALSCYPFFNRIVSPKGCNNSIWNNKTTFYNGFQKLAYLHPNRFTPNRTKVNISENQRYFLLRFSSHNAYHDINATGITDSIAQKLITLLKPHGQVLISSERPLPEEFEKYRFKGNLLDIHHYMYYSDLIIGDSQSMSVEAAMLGIPNIRFNNFVGKISVLKELEQDYELSYGIISSDSEALIDKTRELLYIDNLKVIMQKRRDRMLNEKIDVTAFFVWFIENYPLSVKIMKDNPEYQMRFK